jgi:prepilin signal peptidase PulO-like enzyme (type II secretory pathway)
MFAWLFSAPASQVSLLEGWREAPVTKTLPFALHLAAALAIAAGTGDVTVPLV